MNRIKRKAKKKKQQHAAVHLNEIEIIYENSFVKKFFYFDSMIIILAVAAFMRERRIYIYFIKIIKLFN